MDNMKCSEVKECLCPKTSCTNNGRCCACVARHLALNSLPFCLRGVKDKDKDK